MATRTIQRGPTNSQPASSRSNPLSGAPKSGAPAADTTRPVHKKPAVFHTPSNILASIKSTPSNDTSNNRKPSEASSTETAQNYVDASASHPSANNSLFDEPSVSVAEILSETNQTVARRGKQTLPTLRVHQLSAPDEELAPEDSISDDDQPPFSMTGWSQYSQIESKVRGYFSELCRRYVLQRLSAHDLMNYCTSTIPKQDIVIDETNNKIYHVDRPELTQPTYPIEDAEILKVRSVPQFGEPFTESDPNPNRRSHLYSPIGFKGIVPQTLGVNSGNNTSMPPAGLSGFNGNHGGSNGGPGNNHNFNRDTPPHLLNQNNNRSGPPGGPGGDPNGNSPPGDPGDPNDGPPSEDSDDGTGTEREGKHEWVYDPMPQSEDEMMKAAFKPIETVIKTYLHHRPLKGNAANV
ncbi:hypothetical protein L218DRAFT_1004357 [Marasmius fiardii PR-910]|nr:hypothetical protein L218DRAFT_1004357 [Marasmius fiardii PR-910]